MNQIGIGVIGAGWWATQFHVPAISQNEGATLVGLADPDAQRLAAAKDSFAPPLSSTDYRELLADRRVEGVVIATPHSTHYELARDALLAGKHVLLEKPMTLSGETARELKKIATEKNLALIVGHTYQFTAQARRAREVVSGGQIGEVSFVSALFSSMVSAYYQGDPETYREVFNFPVNAPRPDTYSDKSLSGGGQGWTQVIHLMDMVFFVTSLAPSKVFSRLSNQGLGVDLIDSMSFELSNGALGTAGSTGQLQPGQQQQQELRYYGSEGFLLQDLINGRMSISYNDGREEELPDLAPDEIYPTSGPVDRLVYLCQNGVDEPEILDSSISAVEFLETAYASAESGNDEAVVRNRYV